MKDCATRSWDKFPVHAHSEDKVSEHFKLYELACSETASRRGIDNSFPGAETLRAAVYPCRNVLESIRLQFGAFAPNSGWIHISLCPPGHAKNRRQVLSYVLDPANRRYAYAQDLKASL